MNPEAIHNEAHEAGLKAGNETYVRPMVVTQRENPFDRNSKIVYQETVADGVCGFAWIKIKPARGKFVAWLKSQNIGDTSYSGGYDIWVSHFNQSFTRKEEYARAYAHVLGKHGITAIPQSRLD